MEGASAPSYIERQEIVKLNAIDVNMDMMIQQTDSYRQVIAWLRGGDMTPDPCMETKLHELITAVVMQCVVENRKEIQRMCTAEDRRERRLHRTPSPISIKAIMEQCGCEYVPSVSRTHAEVPIDDIGDLPEADPVSQEHTYDSLTFAKAMVHMAHLEGRELNMSQIQVILYIAYGVWLAQNDERLFQEHPQAWQYGPVFPRVYSKMKKGSDDFQEQYLNLMNDSPERFAFLERCFRRYAWTRASDLVAPHVSNGTPWSMTRKRNPDSPTARIEDDLIREWFLPRVSASEDD